MNDHTTSTTSATSTSTTPATTSTSTTTHPNSAFIRQNIRKYGSYLTVPTPLPETLEFQIVDMKLLDPHQIFETNVDYKSKMTSDHFYGACGQTVDSYRDNKWNYNKNNSNTNNHNHHNNNHQHDNSNNHNNNHNNNDNQSMQHSQRLSEIVMLGRTDLGNSICVRVPFRPFCYLHLTTPQFIHAKSSSDSIQTTNVLMKNRFIRNFISQLCDTPEDQIILTPFMKKRLYEWVPDPKDPHKTEELPVWKIEFPSKRILDRFTDRADPQKSYGKILKSILDKVRKELAEMQKKTKVSKAALGRMKGLLYSVDKRIMMVKKGIESINQHGDPFQMFSLKHSSSSSSSSSFGSSSSSSLSSSSSNKQSSPSKSPLPPLPEFTFKCKDLDEVWSIWLGKFKAVWNAVEQWHKTGFYLSGVKDPVIPQVWESTVDQVMNFSTEHQIISSGWVKVQQYHEPEWGYISHSQIECVCDSGHCLSPLIKNSMAPLLVASVDGEMYSPNHRQFPSATRKNNPVIAIGVSLNRTNSSEIERFMFCLKGSDPVPGITTFNFDHEQKLLEAYRDFLAVDADPDFVIGYNILGFDWKYFAERAAKMYEKEEEKEEEQKQTEKEKEKIQKHKNSEKEEECITATTATSEDDEDEDDEDEDDVADEEAADSEHQPQKTILNLGKFRAKLQSDSATVIEENGNDETIIEISTDHIVSDSRFFRQSRIWSEITPCRPQVFRSSAYGERWSFHFDMTGRAVQDLLTYIRREHKLESYKLNAVSEHFLKDHKIDLDHILMFQYFEQEDKERSMIVDYCSKDTILPIQLCRHPKLMIIQNLINMSQVTFTPLPQIINRGQQIKVFNELIHMARKTNHVMNDQPFKIVQSYEGATVLEAKSGWYDCPVAVLDFNSLYPSIIIHKNLCFCTLVLEEQFKTRLTPKDYEEIKIRGKTFTFVKDHILTGVLPALERNLLAARKSVKKQMKSETDKDVYAMLDAKQLAIKVSCNSVYGFTGADGGMYPEQIIAESITATGRTFIETTKDYVLKNYPGSDVLYGDTDSVMIKFQVVAGSEGVHESFRLGQEVAERISKLFGKDVNLEMEKVYYPWLLYMKKRYAGLKYEVPTEPKCLDTKGIETSRRDWAHLLKDVYRKCIDRVFYQRDVEGAKKLVQDYCQDMIDKKLDFKKFVMSKELKSKYANPEAQVHVNVVKKIAKRSPGTEPQVGDRVPFVIARCKGVNHKKAKVSEKSEDPEYVKKNDIPIDYEYYIEKQLEGPLTKFFQPFMSDPSELFSNVRIQLYNQYAGVGRAGIMAYTTKPSINTNTPAPASTTTNTANASAPAPTTANTTNAPAPASTTTNTTTTTTTTNDNEDDDETMNDLQSVCSRVHKLYHQSLQKPQSTFTAQKKNKKRKGTPYLHQSISSFFDE